jgi:hypothetical protein
MISRPAAIIHRASVPRPSRRPTTGIATTAKNPAGDKTRPALSASYPKRDCSKPGSDVLEA